MPNFLIIGAAKSGTTSLYHFMNQHPQIYLSPVKEPHFFAFEGRDPSTQGPGDKIVSAITNLEAYKALFKETANEIAIGEASTTYLYIPSAAERIRYHLPEAKLIAILRHPSERAYSAFMHLVREGRELLTDFDQALRAEEMRRCSNWEPLWHYTQEGFYYTQLKRYFDRFDQRQIKVYLHEDFSTNPLGILQDIFNFLEVDDVFIPDFSIRYNVSGIPRNRVLHTFVSKQNPVKMILKPFLSVRLRHRIRTKLMNRNLVKPPLSPAVRKQLIDLYREDILKLQNLIKRDLAQWLE
jgi:hypothetical protein